MHLKALPSCVHVKLSRFQPFLFLFNNKEGGQGSWILDQDKKVLSILSTKMKINPISTFQSCSHGQRGQLLKCDDVRGLANGHETPPMQNYT